MLPPVSDNANGMIEDEKVQMAAGKMDVEEDAEPKDTLDDLEPALEPITQEREH